MAMSYVWCFLLLVSIAYSIFAGTAPQTGSAALSGAQSGVTLAISLAGVLCLQALSGSPDASDEMCRLIVLNTASVQLIPSTVAAVRASLGAPRAFEILPAVWLTSLCSVTAGLFAAKLFSRWWRT